MNPPNSPDDPAKVYDLACSLHDAGRLDEAETLYQQLLDQFPENPPSLTGLGTIALQRGNLEQGIEFLERSLQAEPAQPMLLSNLGLALWQSGRLEEALARFDRAIAIAPNFVDAYNFRGVVLKELQRLDEALASYNQAIALKPDSDSVYNNLGVALQDANRLQEALVNFDRAISLRSESASAHSNRGNALFLLGRMEEALASCNQAIALKPDFADAHLNLGLVLDGLGRLDDAITAFDKAIELSPQNSKAYGGKGKMLVEAGRLDEGRACLNKSSELGNAESSSLGMLLSLKRNYQEDDPHFRQLEALYNRRSSLPLSEQSRLGFAMGKALEELGRYDEAFAAYDESNRLCQSIYPYDTSEDERLLAEVSTSFSFALFEKYSALAPELPAYHNERVPIFIVGMPRSGTSLIEQVLATHPALYGAGELTTISELNKKVELPSHNVLDWEKYFLSLRELGREYLDTVWELAPDARYITDKMPHNFQYLGLIHMMLPNAKIIHAMRNPMDVCFSCYASRFKQGHGYCYEQGALGRHYLFYHRLMQHWHNVLPEGRILDVRYEDTVTDLESQARRILEYIGIPWDPACLSFFENQRAVRTISSTQVRKPIYSSSVARWKRFERHLEPLAKIVSTVNY